MVMNPTTALRRYQSTIFAALVLALIAVATASCSKHAPTKDELLSQANAAVAAGHFAEAAKDYREVLRIAPDDSVAMRQLGILYHDQGQFPQADQLLKKVAALSPDDLEVQLKLALTLQSQRQYKEAREAALRVLDKQPGHEEALVLLANTAFGLNDADEMRKFIDGLRAKDQDRAGYHLAFGQLDLRQNDQAGAENEFKTALALDPKSVIALTALANFYWGRNDLKSADQFFKSATELSPPRSLAWLRYADFKLRIGAVTDAEKILADITQKSPEYLPARVYEMKIACDQHRTEDCATRSKEILAADPINFDALFMDGVLNLTKGDAAKAVREFEFLNKNFAQNPRVRYQLAVAYLLYAKGANPVDQRNAVDSAESNLSEAVKLDPHFDQAILLLSEQKIVKGVPAAAVDLLTPLVKQQPENAQAHYLLGTAYLAQQQLGSALAIYKEMTKSFPKDPQPPYLAGAILLAQHQPTQAREAFETSLEVSPDYMPAVDRLVDLDIADKQYAVATDRLQKLIDKNPKQAQVWAIRSKIYLAQKDFAHAESDLLKAIELDPKFEPAYLLLAKLYVASNMQDQAIKKLNAFVEENKDDKAKSVPALVQLATLQQSLKNFNDARGTYEKLLTVSPNLPLALNNLALLYSDNLGQLDKAYDLAKKAKEAVPNDPHIADTLGWIMDKKGNYSDALPLLQDSASKLSSEPDVQFHLGTTQYMLGADEPARLALQQATESTTDFPGKDEARRQLAVLAIDVKTGNPADVQPKLESYLREQPNDPQAQIRLAQVQEREGAPDKAVQTYEKIIAGNPQFAPATRRLAILYSQRPNDEAKAFDLATKARQVYPDDPELAKALGILNYRRGYYPQSAELLKLAAAKSKDDPELLYYLGQAQHQLKQWEGCANTLQQATSLGLSSKLAEEAKPALAACSAELDKSKGIASYRGGDFAQSAKLLGEAADERKNDPELLYYLGQSYHQLKKLDECKDTLQHALNLSLSPQLADEAKRALTDCSEASRPQ
jgi:tetratricopeptide (TPR) repeat protein